MPVTYEPLATITLNSAQTDVTFSSISSSYTDLILVADYITSTTTESLNLRFNSDTSSNYSRTQLYGTGSTAGSNRGSSETSLSAIYGGATARANSTIHIMNYANTTTHKSVIYRINDTANLALVGAGIWRKAPEAINTILIFSPTSNNIASGSTFTLYGIKAA